MLKKVIEYINFEEQPTKRTCYFALSKREIVELQASEKMGFGEMLKRLAEEEDEAQALAQLKRIILMSYGVRSDDGEDRFIKTEELRERFSQSLAFEKLWEDMMEKPGEGAGFVKGIVPKELAKQFEEAQPDQDKPTGPPRPPIPTSATES